MNAPFSEKSGTMELLDEVTILGPTDMTAREHLEFLISHYLATHPGPITVQIRSEVQGEIPVF